MAAASLSSYGGQNVGLMRSGMGRSTNSLVAMLASCNGPHGGFQVARSSGGLEDAIVGCGGQKRPFYAPTFDGGAMEEPELEDVDELDSSGLSGRVEKKRRLSFDQVRSLERNFEVENKLEPERKMQLASELGLQPRQVAVWFQNRRARWKTKQLERDYEMLNSGYLKLKAEFESVLREKAALQAEVHRLSGTTSPIHYSQSVDSAHCKSELAQCSPPTMEPATTTPTIEVCKAEKEADSTVDSSSELLDADSPRTTAASNHHHHNHHHVDVMSDLASCDFAPESCFGTDATFAPVKMEDEVAAYQVDPTCSYFLPPMLERQMLPWWDWA